MLNYDPDAQSRVYGAVGALVQEMDRTWSAALWLAGAEPMGMSRGQWRQYSRGLARMARTALLAAAWGCGALGAVLLLRRLWRLRRAQSGARAGMAFYRRMERLLARRGFYRRNSETPWEFRDALALEAYPAVGEVTTVTEAFCEARYGGRRLSAADAKRVSQALRAIRRAPAVVAP